MRAAQARNAARRRIAVGARHRDRLDQLLDDMRRRRHVRIAHAEIDDVGAARARLRLQPVDLLENVGRQAPDAVKFAVHALVPLTPNQDPMPNGWAFEHHRSGPWGSRQAAVVRPTLPVGSRFDRCRRSCRRPIPDASPAPCLQIGDRRLPLFGAHGFSELLGGGVKGRWRRRGGDRGIGAAA